MSNVICFPSEFVVISSGTVRSRIENQHGLGPLSDPRFEYCVEWIDRATGGSIVWTGETHAEALEAAAEWGLPVIDKTGSMQ